MHQVAKPCLGSWSKHRMSRGYHLERLDQPPQGAIRIVEPVDQDRLLPGKSAPRELDTVSNGASIIRIWRQDLLDRSVLVRAVVAAEARQLDLQSSVRKLAQDKITHMPGQGIQTLKA